jgi:hypothetical protein
MRLGLGKYSHVGKEGKNPGTDNNDEEGKNPGDNQRQAPTLQCPLSFVLHGGEDPGKQHWLRFG